MKCRYGLGGMGAKVVENDSEPPKCTQGPRGAYRVGLVTTSDTTWVRSTEAARRLGVTPRTLYRFIDDGKLPAYRFGRVIRLKESEIDDFIEASRIEPGTLNIADVEALEDSDAL